MFKTTKGNEQGVNSITNVSQYAGADVNKFNECMNTKRYMDKIKQQIAICEKFGVNSTPTIIIIDNKNKYKYTISEAQPSGAIKSVINKISFEDNKKTINYFFLY